MLGAGQIRVALAALCCLAAHAGCDDVSGGAVELSWKLRPASSDSNDKFVDCDRTQDVPDPTDQTVTLTEHFAITGMRLVWVNDDGTAGYRSWLCSDNHGVTGFELPAGTALLSVAPECADGLADPETYISPAPQQRSVNLGDTVTLGAIQLVVRESYCETQTCICRAP